MSNYPSGKDSFTVIVGDSDYMDTPGKVLHERLNQYGSAVKAIEDVLGTTDGSSVLANFDNTDRAARVNNETFGTPSVTGGTISSATVNNATIGTPAITNGTATNLTNQGVTSFVARKGTPVNLENMGTAKTVYFSQGETQYGTLDQGTCIITFGSAEAGEYLTLYLYQGTAGDGTVEFGGTVHAQDSETLSLGTAANAKNILGFRVNPTNADEIDWIASATSLGTF